MGIMGGKRGRMKERYEAGKGTTSTLLSGKCDFDALRGISGSQVFTSPEG